MRLRFLSLPLVALALGGQVAPPSREGEPVVATSPRLAPLLRALALEFARSPGGSGIVIAAVGSDVAMARLTTGSADAAVIGRLAFDPEAKAYEWVYRQPPAARPIFGGAVARPGDSPALAFRVNAANPLKSITTGQIRAAFGQTASRFTWRALGVGGALADRTIRLVVPDTESGTGRFMRAAALGGQVQLPWNRVTEIAPGGFADDGYTARITAAVARDPAAIGVGDGAAMPGTRILAVVVNGRAVLPGQAGYPFERTVMAYSDPEPRPAVAGFLRYVQSRAAASIIARAGYRPQPVP